MTNYSFIRDVCGKTTKNKINNKLMKQNKVKQNKKGKK